jgi:ATPase subunit of ABC transporter with duplicated ATPase domains
LPQTDELTEPRSRGELRKLALEQAQASRAEVLLLDEPTLHLDEAAVEWLRTWLGEWAGCVIVASHDRRLLAHFRHFFVVSESGCHYFGGSLAELETHLEREHQALEGRYVRNLRRLAAHEEHTEQVARPGCPRRGRATGQVRRTGVPHSGVVRRQHRRGIRTEVDDDRPRTGRRVSGGRAGAA